MILLAIALLFSNWDKINHWAYILPALAAVCLFRPTVLTMIQGQLAGFLLLLAAAATWCWQRERWFAGDFYSGC